MTKSKSKNDIIKEMACVLSDPQIFGPNHFKSAFHQSNHLINASSNLGEVPIHR